MALEITVRYADEIDLEGSPEALRELAKLVRSAVAVTIDLAPVSGRRDPYEGYLRKVIIQPDELKVRVRRNDDRLIISGTASARDIFADNLLYAAETHQMGEHGHVDYYPDHYYLAEGSEPLVISQTLASSHR